MSLATEYSPDTIKGIARLIREARQNPLSQAPGVYQGAPDRVARDITTGTGLTFYDLETPAKLTQPFTTVLSPMTPRVAGRGDIQTHWRTITGVNTTKLEGGVPEGVRSARITNTGAQVFATYATLGLEDDVTEEAWEAGQGLEDLRARMAVDLLYAGKVVEERMLTAGNGATAAANGQGGQALGTCGAATLSTATTGGTIADGVTVYVGVVALTNAGLNLSVVSSVSVGGGGPRLISLTSPVAETYTYKGGSSDGSAAANIVTGSSGSNTNSVSASCTAVSGALGYAWFVSVNPGSASHQYLAAITNINSVKITANTVAPPAAATGFANDYQTLIADGNGDCSQNANAFTGMIPLAFQFGTVSTLATGTPGSGTTLTATGAAAIAEIDAVLRTQFTATQTSPDLMLVGVQEMDTINTLLVQNGGAPLIRFASDQGGSVSPQAAVGQYLNKFTTDSVNPLMKVVLSPHVPNGTILMVTSSVPGAIYPGNNLGRLWELHMRREWYQQEWPPRTRAYESGVYESATLAHAYPQTLSLITNIAKIPGH